MRAVLMGLLFVLCVPAQAGEPVFRADVERPLAQVYPAVKQAMEANNFFVVFEPDIGSNLARFKERWGEDYNRNELSAIRSMVFCNGWYANQVSNKDPRMLALCPMHLTLIAKDGTSSVLFVRPTHIAANSAAKAPMEDLEKEVIAAIRQGIADAKAKGASGE